MPRSMSFLRYAGDRDEPAHIHVEFEDKIAKFWLNPKFDCKGVVDFRERKLGESRGR